ncbi:MAG: hypothetical protein EOP79_11555 [Variovorax sp.]|nr:MAG: hypothetical protein EOP79_11555 [Variovorax sp.]
MVVRIFHGLLLLLLLACRPLADRLPAQWGWENGVLENLQVLILLAGGAFALAICKRDWKSQRALLALVVLPLWAVLVARELSWGAVFLTPLDITAAGPQFSSRTLWYKPAIYPLVGLLLAVAGLVAARHRLDRTLRSALAKKHVPWFESFLIVAAAYVSGCAEGHVRCLIDAMPSQQEVLEELVEVVAYAALWLAQYRVFLSPALRENATPRP